jgi:aryl-alcohol dehydrogenase-like predicted oxidoreductase
LEETLEAYAQLIKEGKVLAIGASNYTEARLAEALVVSEVNGFPRYETLQPEYNLFDRSEYESGLEALCLEKELGVITYYSLASGFLSGKYRSEADLSKSTRGKGVKKYLNTRGFRVLDALDRVAAAHHATPASVALAWLIARPSVTAPIVSATNLAQLDELVRAATLSLEDNAVALLNEASA